MRKGGTQVAEDIRERGESIELGLGVVGTEEEESILVKRKDFSSIVTVGKDEKMAGKEDL